MTETYDIVCFGELLWDLLPTGKVAGGAPCNIINRVNALGGKGIAISSLGTDALGDELLELVKQNSNPVQFIQRHLTLPTSTVQIEVGSDGEPHYNILAPVAWDDIHASPEIVEAVKASRIFLYSSLALRDSRSRAALFGLLPHASMRICDLNLREGHYSNSTILQMLEMAHILRTNEHELAIVSGLLGLNSLEIAGQLRELADTYAYSAVIATLGPRGAIAYSNGQIVKQPVFPVKVVDTVGSGDSFLAGFSHSYLQGKNLRECLRFACAIGALTASKAGGTPSITQNEIDAILA